MAKFEPGQTGNPNGRPKKLNTDWRKRLEKALTESKNGEPSRFEKAIKGLDDAMNEKGWLKQDACKYIIEQCAGKTPQATTKGPQVTQSWVELVGKAQKTIALKTEIKGELNPPTQPEEDESSGAVIDMVETESITTSGPE